MELRPELCPPKHDPAKVAELVELAYNIENHLLDVDNYRPLLEQFNQLAKSNHEIEQFYGLDGSIDVESFVELALYGRPKIIDTISDDEYIEIIERICKCSEKESVIDYWEKFLEINLKNPHIGDLIFWSDEELTPEEILKKAKDYKPFAL